MKLINTDTQRAFIAPFESIEQLNANTTAIRAQYAEFMTPTEKAVLDVLHRYATKQYGVSYLSKTSIADKVGVSRRQVIRICNKFEAMGIIVQYATDRRAGGGRTSNTIVFLTQISARAAFVEESVQVTDNMQESSVDTGDVTANVTSLEALKDAPKELRDLKITGDTEACAALNKQGLVSKLPKTLQYALAPFFDSKELYEMTGVIYKAKSAVDSRIMIEDHEDEYYNAILSVMNAYGRGKLQSVQAVLYSAVKTVTRSIWLAERKSLLGF